MKKNLILSFVFFAISLWMASYIVLPYFAIGGIQFYWYDYKNPVNALIDIIIPSLIFAVCLYFANVHFGKALPVVRFPVLWMIGIVLIFALISFGIFYRYPVSGYKRARTDLFNNIFIECNK